MDSYGDSTNSSRFDRSHRALSYSVFEVIEKDRTLLGCFVEGVALCSLVEGPVHIRIKIKGIWTIHSSIPIFSDPYCGYSILDFSHPKFLPLSVCSMSPSPGDEVVIYERYRRTSFIKDESSHLLSSDPSLPGTPLLSSDLNFLGLSIGDGSYIPWILMKRGVRTRSVLYSSIGVDRPATFQDCLLHGMESIQGYVKGDEIYLSISSDQKEYKLGLNRGMYSVLYLEQRIKPGTKVLVKVISKGNTTTRLEKLQEKLEE